MNKAIINKFIMLVIIRNNYANEVNLNENLDLKLYQINYCYYHTSEFYVSALHVVFHWRPSDSKSPQVPDLDSSWFPIRVFSKPLETVTKGQTAIGITVIYMFQPCVCVFVSFFFFVCFCSFCFLFFLVGVSALWQDLKICLSFFFFFFVYF